MCCCPPHASGADVSALLELMSTPSTLACAPAVDAYYAGSSSSLSIPDVRVPLLVIQVRLPLFWFCLLNTAAATH